MKNKSSLQPLTIRQILKWARHTKYSYFPVFICGQQILAQHRSHTDPHHLLSDSSPEGLHRDTRDKGKVKEGLTTKEGSLSLTCNEEQHTEISCVVSALCSEDGSLETTAHTVERVGEMLYTKLCQCLSRPTYSTSGISFNKHTVTS